MNLNEEMKLWEERANDEFGQILKKIAKADIEYNVLSEYITGYALDGNRKYTAKCIYNILYNYDILGNHKNVKKLVDKLTKLANN